MKLLIVSPYYNNSHFIPIQILSFRKYFKNCFWKLLVIDDSTEITNNILSGNKENIKKVCDEFTNSIIYFKFPQHLHTSDDGCKRHVEILNFFIQQIAPKYSEEYDYLVSFDSDMCLISNFDAELELKNYDIIGPKRVQWLGNRQCDNNYPIFDFIFVHCCFFNLKTIKNINEIDFSPIKNTTTDTGAMLIKFLLNNPQYKIKFLEVSTGYECVDRLYSFEFFANNLFIHFGIGSNWYTNNLSCIYPKRFIEFIDLIEKGLDKNDVLIIKQSKEKWMGKKTLAETAKRCKLENFIEYGII